MHPYIGLVADGIPPIKGGSAIGIPSPPAVLFPDGRVMMPSIEACEQLQGFPRGWTEADYQDRRSPRWKMLGNAMPVPIADWAAQCIAKNHPNIQIKANGDLRSDNWPLAAFGNRKGRSGVTVSEYPLSRVSPGIEAYVDEHWKPLSRRALDGFVGRAETSNLRFPAGFLDALRKARAQVS